MITELIIKKKKINIFFNFITKSYFSVQTSNRPISTCHFIMKAANKDQLQQMEINDSSNSEFKGFMKLYQKNVLQYHILSYDKHYHQTKLIYMNILQMKKIQFSNQIQIITETNFYIFVTWRKLRKTEKKLSKSAGKSQDEL